MKPHRFVLSIFILLCASSSFGLANNERRIRRVDDSLVSAKELTAKIKRIADEAQITGLAIVIINDYRVVYQEFLGAKNKQTGEKPTAETVFYAASLTKPLFARGFLKLVERRIFDLDAPVYKYLKKPIGEYEKWRDLAKDEDFEKITARMILSHAAGLPILRQIYGNKVNLIAAPNTRFYYSNEGFNLLGFVVEEHTGRKLEDLIEETVFTPLKMRRSRLIWRADFENDFAVGHDAQGNSLGAQKRASARAAGSMNTTATDYARFVIAAMKREGLSKKMSAEIFKPQIKATSERAFGPLRERFTGKVSDRNLSWGLGWGLFKSRHGAAFFHGGHTEGWQNYAVAYPDKKIAVILMSNSDNFEPTANKILDLAIADAESPLEWLGYFDK